MSEWNVSNTIVARAGRPTVLWAAFALWSIAIIAGAVWMTRYSGIPGPAEAAATHWPAQSTIGLSSNSCTLVMFAHPRCPCTAASANELEVLMARCQGQISAYVLFLKPAGLPGSWAETALWRQAACIPGVRVQMDLNGAEARRFGAGTSGDTLVYGPDGRLRFHGGITISRGHAGDNPGLDAIIAITRGQALPTSQTSVFGCALFERECLKTGRP